MAKKTATFLRDNLEQRDPEEWQGDLLDTVFSVGSSIWVDSNGDDDGDGVINDPFKTIGKALGAVTDKKKSIFVLPGDYNENVEWPDVNDVRLIALGRNQATILGDPTAGGAPVVKIAPGKDFGATFKSTIENVAIKHNGTGLMYDRSNVGTSEFDVHLDHVPFLQEAGTSIVGRHNGSAGVIFEWEGGREKIEGPIFLESMHENDEINFIGGKLRGGLETSTAAFSGTADFLLQHIEILHEGLTGGNDSQRFNVIYCHSRTSDGNTFAVFDASDAQGDHTGNIVS